MAKIRGLTPHTPFAYPQPVSSRTQAPRPARAHPRSSWGRSVRPGLGVAAGIIKQALGVVVDLRPEKAGEDEQAASRRLGRGMGSSRGRESAFLPSPK